MATHDYVIANGTGFAVRTDLNNALAAIVSNNSSSSEPSTTYAYQWWADTNANVLKIRNSANNAWITLRELDGTILMEDGTAGAPGLAFAADLDTGILRPGDNQINFATAGAERLSIGSTEIVFNEPSNDVDFRVESSGQTHMLFVDGGNDRVGIGTSSPSVRFDLAGAANSEYMRVGGSSRPLRFSCSAQGGADNANHDIDVDSSAGNLSFSIGTFEKMRLDSSGRLLIGVSSSYANANVDDLQVGNNSASAESGITLGSTSGSGIRFADAGNASAGIIEYSHTLDSMILHTGGAERLRIGSEGHLFNTCNDNSNVSLTLKKASGGDAADFFTCLNSSSTEKFTIKSNGNAENANGTYTSISDVKLKENIVDASSQWDDIKAIQIRNWNFKEETGYETHTQIGVVAQELETVCPGLVDESPDRDEEGNDLGTVTKSVKQSILYMKAVKALQEAMNRIETLEAKVAALEAG